MRHSLLKPDGLVQTYDARTERPVEQDTHQCCHCGRHWVYERGSGRKRGFCTRCERITCGARACDVCIPQEARLENLEAGRPELTPPRPLVTSGWQANPGGKILVPANAE